MASTTLLALGHGTFACSNVSLSNAYGKAVIGSSNTGITFGGTFRAPAVTVGNVGPFIVQYGTSTASGGSAPQTVSFGQTFGAVPKVILSVFYSTDDLSVNSVVVTNTTVSNFQFSGIIFSAAGGRTDWGSCGVRWLAIGPPA
jgi:hypothetical protein